MYFDSMCGYHAPCCCASSPPRLRRGGRTGFETELYCHCDSGYDRHGCDRHHSHHPFDICLLQELLSHLVFTTSDDHLSLAKLMKTESNDYWIPALAAFLPSPHVPVLPEIKVYHPIRAVLLVSIPLLCITSLRAPPYISF